MNQQQIESRVSVSRAARKAREARSQIATADVAIELVLKRLAEAVAVRVARSSATGHFGDLGDRGQTLIQLASMVRCLEDNNAGVDSSDDEGRRLYAELLFEARAERSIAVA